ncbi:class I SAM-dependent methyltransferase [Oleidesulfovibrio sp.]|uniref:class I SAM-dependent methyltransferase n=1 Tax=Oleidesulfovibrio sp. TaxID=2909707 RepID=UPI003A83B734
MNEDYVDPYGRFARYYDRVLNPVLDPVRGSVALQLETLQTASVLDVCCGTARQAAFLPAPVTRYVGVDASDAMLRAGALALSLEAAGSAPSEVRYAGTRRGRAAIELLCTDGQALPFAEKSFDAALIAFALHEKPLEEAFTVAREALRVATSLVIVDYTMPERTIECPAALLMHLPERIAGGEHYRHFRAFMRAGGLQGFAYALGLKEKARQRLFYGGAAIAVYD